MNPISSALLIHRTGAILPFVHNEYNSDWVFEVCGGIYKQTIERFINQIDKATLISIMMIFWGTL